MSFSFHADHILHILKPLRRMRIAWPYCADMITRRKAEVSINRIDRIDQRWSTLTSNPAFRSTSKSENGGVDSLNDHRHAIVVQPAGRVRDGVVSPIAVESHVGNHDGVVACLP